MPFVSLLCLEGSVLVLELCFSLTGFDRSTEVDEDLSPLELLLVDLSDDGLLTLLPDEFVLSLAGREETAEPDSLLAGRL